MVTINGMKSLPLVLAAFKKKMKALTVRLDRRAAKRSSKARDTRRSRTSASKATRRYNWIAKHERRQSGIRSTRAERFTKKLDAFTITYLGETLQRYKAVREAKLKRDHDRVSGRSNKEHFYPKDTDGSDAEYSRFWGMVAYKVQEDPRPRFRNAPQPYDPLRMEHPYWQFQIENPEY